MRVDNALEGGVTWEGVDKAGEGRGQLGLVAAVFGGACQKGGGEGV